MRTADGQVLATEARWLATFGQRGRGWIARPADHSLALGIPLTEGERVHTWGVPFPLELLYCGAEGTLLRVLTLPPRRIAPPVAGAVVVWERVAREGPSVVPGVGLRWHD